MAKNRSIKDKRYEQKHKEERKAKYMIWGTSVPRKYAKKINEFLAKYGFTKVQLIEAGFKALLDEAAKRILLPKLWTTTMISLYWRLPNINAVLSSNKEK